MAFILVLGSLDIYSTAITAAIIDFTLSNACAMSRNRKRRACAKCGRPAKGHPGPMGHRKCPNSPRPMNSRCRDDVNDFAVVDGDRHDGVRDGSFSSEGSAIDGRGPDNPSSGPSAARHWVELDNWGPGAVDRRLDSHGMARDWPQAGPRFLHSPEDHRREHSCPPPIDHITKLPNRSDYCPPYDLYGAELGAWARRDDLEAPLPMAHVLRTHSRSPPRTPPRSPPCYAGPASQPARRHVPSHQPDERRPPFLLPPRRCGQPDPWSARTSFNEYDSRPAERPIKGTEHINTKTKLAALHGEFIDLTELLSSNIAYSDVNEFRTVVDSEGNLSVRSTRPRRAITSSFKWLEAWSLYELIVCSCHGFLIFNEMVTYRLFILNLFSKFKLPFVLSYDTRHRLMLGARRSFEFASLNSELYIVTFDSLAIKGSARCARCSSSEHATNECPYPFRNGGQASGDLPRQRARPGDRPAADRASEICYLFQDGKCKAGEKCVRKHACINCGGPEGHKSCTKCNKGNGAKSKS